MLPSHLTSKSYCMIVLNLREGFWYNGIVTCTERRENRFMKFKGNPTMHKLLQHPCLIHSSRSTCSSVKPDSILLASCKLSVGTVQKNEFNLSFAFSCRDS